MVVRTNAGLGMIQSSMGMSMSSLTFLASSVLEAELNISST